MEEIFSRRTRSIISIYCGNRTGERSWERQHPANSVKDTSYATTTHSLLCRQQNNSSARLEYYSTTINTDTTALQNLNTISLQPCALQHHSTTALHSTKQHHWHIEAPQYYITRAPQQCYSTLAQVQTASILKRMNDLNCCQQFIFWIDSPDFFPEPIFSRLPPKTLEQKLSKGWSASAAAS